MASVALVAQPSVALRPSMGWEVIGAFVKGAALETGGELQSKGNTVGIYTI